jgi:outer membrane murein-binding lipoprotein Lpp
MPVIEYPSLAPANLGALARDVWRLADNMNRIMVNLGAENFSESYRASLQKLEGSASVIDALQGLLSQGQIPTTRKVRDLLFTLEGAVNVSIAGVISNVDVLQGAVTSIQGDVTGLETDVGALQGEVSGLETDVGSLQTNVGDLQSDVSAAQLDIGTLQSAQGDMEGEITDLQNADATLSGDLQEQVNTLIAQISAVADNVEATAGSIIAQFEDKIATYVEENNIISLDADTTLEDLIASTIQQTAGEVLITLTEFVELSTAVGEFIAEFGTYFSYTANGLEIGLVGDGQSPVVARYANNRIEFALAGTETVLAWFGQDAGGAWGMHIDTAVVGKLSIGNAATGFMDVDMSSVGLTFRWR